MNGGRWEICPPAPCSRTSTFTSPAASAATRVHLQVRIPLERTDLHERSAIARPQPLLGPPVGALAPAPHDERGQLITRRTRAQWTPEVGAIDGVETAVPLTIGGETAAIAGATERRGGGGDDAEDG